MAGAETTVERLRHFLRELSPGARSLLIGELERSVLRGEDVVARTSFSRNSAALFASSAMWLPA